MGNALGVGPLVDCFGKRARGRHGQGYRDAENPRQALYQLSCHLLGSRNEEVSQYSGPIVQKCVGAGNYGESPGTGGRPP